MSKLIDDLVEKITVLAEESIDKPEFHSSANDFEFNENKFKAGLRKLLQSSQPKGVGIVLSQAKFNDLIIECHHYYVGKHKKIDKDLLKSLGIKVVEK